MKKQQITNLIWLFIFFVGCNGQTQNLSVYNSLGKNENDFNSLIEKYKNEPDRIKLQALYFLLSNMRYHGNDTDLVDVSTIDKNISDAYKVSRKELTSKTISFENFCEYILPYRNSNEPLENWREQIANEYGHIIDSVRKATHSAAEITTYLNNLIKKGFKYEETGYPAEKKNWSYLYHEKRGTCQEMTSTIIFPLRTFGIPSSIDYTLCWANSNGYAHMWNALIYNDSIIPFMGLEANPDGVFKPFTLIPNKNPSKTTYRLCGKVFRRTFSPNLNIPANDIVFKNDRFFKDVTNQYFTVTNVTLPIEPSTLQNSTFYVCNYTYGKWVPVYFGLKKQDSVVFANLANNILYMPVLIDSSLQWKQYNFPIAILKSGKTMILKPDLQNLCNIQIRTIQPIEEDQLAAINRIKDWNSKEFISTMNGIVEGSKRSKPKNNLKYSLYYWDKKWKLARISVPHQNILVFRSVPSHCLYKVVGPEETGIERPFSYENFKQKWW